MHSLCIVVDVCCRLTGLCRQVEKQLTVTTLGTKLSGTTFIPRSASKFVSRKQQSLRRSTGCSVPCFCGALLGSSHVPGVATAALIQQSTYQKHTAGNGFSTNMAQHVQHGSLCRGSHPPRAVHAVMLCFPREQMCRMCCHVESRLTQRVRKPGPCAIVTLHAAYCHGVIISCQTATYK